MHTATANTPMLVPRSVIVTRAATIQHQDRIRTVRARKEMDGAGNQFRLRTRWLVPVRRRHPQCISNRVESALLTRKAANCDLILVRKARANLCLSQIGELRAHSFALADSGRYSCVFSQQCD